MKTAGVHGARKLARRRCREALVKSRGNLTVAAEMLGCSRQNVDQMVSRHADLKALCHELTEIKLDTLEDKLYELATAEKSNVTAAIATLNAKGRSRGWGYYKTDVTVSGTVEHNHHLHDHRRLQHLDDAALGRLIEERRAVLKDQRPMIDITPKKGED
jgi:hypothetical protein